MRILLLSTLLLFSIACGESDEKNGDTENNEPGITEILPMGYQRVSSARINHAGTRIAMVVERDGMPQLITTSLTGTEITEIGVEGLSYLSSIAWSSDDNSIYFSATGIGRVPIEGGITEKIVDAFAVASFDVSPDETTIAWATNGGTALNIAPLSTIPITGAATMVDKASEPRFSPDSKTLLVIVGTEFTTMDIDGMNPITHAGGVNYLSNGAWIDNDSFLYLADDKINKFEIGSKKTSLVNEEGFAALELDYNAAGGKYIYLTNGIKELQIGNF